VFGQINGLPVHPLVVHLVVVLLPLAAIGTIAIAVRPVWRRPYGALVVLFAAAATALTLSPRKAGSSWRHASETPVTTVCWATG
jgi:hypothetical protein